MASQIFKDTIPIEMLITLLQHIAVKTDKCYIVNNNVYKKGIFTTDIHQFFEECRPYYYISKRKYLEPPITYNSFVTIIRQICKINNIKYTTHIKYDKSNYDIIYSIFII